MGRLVGVPVRFAKLGLRGSQAILSWLLRSFLHRCAGAMTCILRVQACDTLFACPTCSEKALWRGPWLLRRNENHFLLFSPLSCDPGLSSGEMLARSAG